MNFDIVEKNRTAVLEKIKESALSVMPIIVIVTLLCLFAVPMNNGLLLSFFAGAVLVILGIGFFTLGAEQAMTPIGSKIGTAMTKTENLPFIILVSFTVGFAVTVAEPDLRVLAETVPHINSTVLLAAVGAGVGFFLAVCMVRILTGVKLRTLLMIFYGIIFILAFFTDAGFLAVSFDSGGVTTGPMTVPFILALGVGVSNIRSDSAAESDSFGLVSLCSAGPIFAVLILGFFYPGQDAAVDTAVAEYDATSQIGRAYIKALPEAMLDVALSLLPIVVIFFLFQLFSLRLSPRSLAKIAVGIIYTYLGLVLFLTGVNVGFSSLGEVLGKVLANGNLKWLMIPFSALLGWFIISAEPAVTVLERQIEEVSAGAIPGKVIKLSLAAAIAAAMALSMLRVLTGISLFCFLIPGYILAFALSFAVPEIYTAIAFDSGGVASGPMTATFMLRLFIGASTALGGNPLTDAFGVVAMVALMPLISIQIVGVIYGGRKSDVAETPAAYGDCDIVELWEAGI